MSPFIVFEGLDGCGKSTQAKLLQQYLKNKNIPVVLTSEPTNGPIGTEIRRLAKRNSLNHQQWAELFIKDRKEHLDQLMEPSLASGKIVICDRYQFSTIAIQSAQGGDMRELIALQERLRKPDLTIYLDVNPEKVVKWMYKRNQVKEVFEAEELLHKTAKSYQQAISLLGKKHNVIVVDGEREIEDVQKEIRKKVDLLILEKDF